MYKSVYLKIIIESGSQWYSSIDLTTINKHQRTLYEMSFTDCFSYEFSCTSVCMRNGVCRVVTLSTLCSISLTKRSLKLAGSGLVFILFLLETSSFPSASEAAPTRSNHNDFEHDIFTVLSRWGRGSLCMYYKIGNMQSYVIVIIIYKSISADIFYIEHLTSKKYFIYS